MAALKENTSNRRRSIATTSQGSRNTAAAAGKRRAHSIVPGDRLSPLAKARRSLAPRKSILKTSSVINTEEAAEPSSQPSQTQSSVLYDDTNIAQSMDFTTDYQARIHDNASRRSFGRRVSFAEHAHVRFFRMQDSNHTNSTGSPRSSPIQLSPEESQPPVLPNENDYPASFSRNRRRSSIRYSVAGSEDMNLTSVNPAAFLPAEDDVSASMNGESILEDNGEDMEVTDVLRGDFVSRRSTSFGGRRPFAPVHTRDSIVFPSDDAIPSDDDQTQSILEGDSQSQSEVDHSGEMEFTVPMGQSLRPPASEDPVWLALRQVTHSGDAPLEPELSSEDDVQVGSTQSGMDLNDAMARLMRVRNSLAGNAEDNTEDMDITTPNPHYTIQDDSLSSADDGLNDDLDEGNQTLNISKVIGRASLGGDVRTSLGYQDSTMDESGIYGSIVPLSSSTPRPSLVARTQQVDMPTSDSQARTAEPQKPAVFQPPSGDSNSLPSMAPTSAIEPPKATPFVFLPPPVHAQTSKPASRPTSPTKPKPKPTFSAAFAPPVAKPSPRKPSNPSTPSQMTPSKRPFSAMQDGTSPARPSPTKRQALTSKTPEEPRETPSQPRISLSLNKVPPMVPDPAAAKRPSGYFARRRSLGTGLLTTQSEHRKDVPTSNSASPSKTGVRHNRVSLGSAPSDAWARFDVNAPVPTIPSTPAPEIEGIEVVSIQETMRRATTSPTSTEEQPPLTSPRPTPLGWAPLESVDVGHTMVADVGGDGGDGGGDQDMIEAEQVGGQVEDGKEFISINQFFSMTNIKFMDELTAPRRSLHPQHGFSQARNPAEIPLSEYYVAMSINVPQLGLFSRVSKDLEGWMERSKADFAQAEEEAAKITPELFTEFVRADEEGQAELLHQLNLIRVNARGQARSDWYDWKFRWVEGLHTTAEQAFSDLQTDANILEPIRRAAEELVPAFEKEYKDIMQELEREQAEVAEIEASDQEYLNDLKASITEQNIEVEALRAELSEHNEQLNYLHNRLQELGVQKKEAFDTITRAQRVLQVQKNSTRAEVFRLRDELETLEDLHRLRVTKVDHNIFECIYALHYKITIPCKNYLPITANIDITRTGTSSTQVKDDFPQLRNVFLRAAKAAINISAASSCLEVVRRLIYYWSSCSLLHVQLRLLLIKYPVEIVPVDGATDGLPGFQARVKVIIPSKKAKVFISFNLPLDIFSHWPLSINSLTFDVDVAYGDVNQSIIAKAVAERINQATPSANYACLLDACIEAQEIYNQ